MARISREQARRRVEKALVETRPEFKSAAWDLAWLAISRLESRAIGSDAKLAAELKAVMRQANRLA